MCDIITSSVFIQSAPFSHKEQVFPPLPETSKKEDFMKEEKVILVSADTGEFDVEASLD